MSLQLPVGSLTVLLGPALARHRVMAALDESTGRCASGHTAVQAVRLVAAPDDPVAERMHALEDVRRGGAAIVLVDRFTEGLASRDRAALLRELAALAGGRAVLVHDRDPVAALAVAGGALRVGASGELAYEPIGEPGYLAS
ncbi:hypothetical protein [Pseudonocardia zijingensis]|uniref:Uncharacterized protein n=1 Tax=Pseudonocardia zijingensis TaxID=153376 RepID=A0ABN1Q9V2_9PSEU